MVSRKPDAICFHCGTPLVRSDVEYSQYMDMTEVQRNEIKEKFIARMQQYNNKLDSLFHMK
jgi:hypothetical protein